MNSMIGIVIDQSYLTPVSAELKVRLDQEVRRPHSDRRDEVADLMHSERFIAAYDACIWWDGCYYCQDASGDWYCVRCGFF